MVLFLAVTSESFEERKQQLNKQKQKFEQIQKQNETLEKQIEELKKQVAVKKAQQLAQTTVKSVVPLKTKVTVQSAKIIPFTGDALAEILRRESGNNPLAVNRSSGACGLGQSLPCSKMLNALGVSSLAEATYEMQLGWVKAYIANRYGTPEKALAFHNVHHWY